MHRKFIVIAVSLFVAFISGCGAFSVPSHVDNAPAAERALAARIDESIVQLRGYKKEGVFYYDTWGTGVVIGPRLIAANAHSVVLDEEETDKKFSALFIDGERVVLKVVAIDRTHDVSLLAPAEDGLRFSVPAVTLAEGLPPVGAPLRMLARLSGFSLGSVERPLEAERRWMLASTLVSRKGDSGSPVYDANGTVVGIHAGRWGVGLPQTYSVPSSYVLKLQRGLGNAYD